MALNDYTKDRKRDMERARARAEAFLWVAQRAERDWRDAEMDYETITLQTMLEGEYSFKSCQR